MDPRILPGLPLLQASFYGIAAFLLIAAVLMTKRAARACGDSPAAASALQRRFAMAAAAWILVVSAASFSGLLLPKGGPPLPFVLMMASVLTLGVLLARSRIGDRLSRGVPLSLLVGIQGFRFPLELAMHRAHNEGLMPIQMSYSGQNFDIITGITALILGIVLATRPVPTWIVHAWNVMGLALLTNILLVAILSTPVFAYFGPDRLNLWVMWMPYTLLPAVMVLAAWAGHLMVFRALMSRAGAR